MIPVAPRQPPDPTAEDRADSPDAASASNAPLHDASPIQGHGAGGPSWDPGRSQAVVDPAVEAGRRLRVARTARGWSIVDVARRLHLATTQVRDLESGSMGSFYNLDSRRRLGGLYCDLLELPRELAAIAPRPFSSRLADIGHARFGAGSSSATRAQQPSRSHAPGRRVLLLALLSVVAVPLALEAWQRWGDALVLPDIMAAATVRGQATAAAARPAPDPSTAHAAGVAGPDDGGAGAKPGGAARTGTAAAATGTGTGTGTGTAAAGFGTSSAVSVTAAGSGTGRGTSSGTNSGTNSGTVGDAERARDGIGANRADPSAAGAPASAGPDPGGASGRLRITAVGGRCWVDVRHAQGRIARTLETGERVDLPAAGVQRVMLGNAPAVRATLDGKPLVLRSTGGVTAIFENARPGR